MTSDAILVTLSILTVLFTLALIRWRRQAVKEYFFNPIENGRTVLGAFILIAGVVTALKSGVAWMMLLALVGIAFGVAYLEYEQPHKEIR